MLVPHAREATLRPLHLREHSGDRAAVSPVSAPWKPTLLERLPEVLIPVKEERLQIASVWNAVVQMSVSPPNLGVETLTPKVMVQEGGAFRRWLAHTGGALMNATNTLRKRPQGGC